MIGGQRLFYARHRGMDDGQPLLLIHGAGGSHLDWPAEMLRLPGAVVSALDLPGHGRSSPPGRTSIADYADVVVSFLDTLDLHDVVVAGHSMGGAIAQVIGLRGSPRISALILVGTGGRLRVADAILDPLREDHETALRTITRLRWADSAPQDLIRAGHELMRQVDQEVLHGDFTACNEFDLMDRLHEIQLPTLVIGGTVDAFTPAKYGQYLADHIQSAQFVAIEGGGHMIALERPNEVAAAITAFLQQI